MRFIVSTLAVLAPFATALVGNDWSFTGQPKGGLRDVTFPFLMANTPHKEGYYFAQQFSFINASEVGYCGIQPRQDQKGRSIVHGVFSSFQAGTTTSDSNCHPGADGGPGVSCAVEFAGDYRDTFYVEVKNVPGTTTWTGTVVDAAAKKQHHVGTWTLPAGAGGIKSSQVGFVEYYPWNDDKRHKCSDLPRVQVVMGHPTSQTAGSGKGTMGKPYEYGNPGDLTKCVGKAGFSTRQSQNPAGWRIRVGF